MIKQYILFTLLISQVFAGATDACDDTGSHSDEWWFVPELSPFEIFVGCMIVLFTFISILPQCLKIVRRRSSMGLSATYIFLMACNQVFASTNGTIFNFPYMQSCPHVGFGVCIPSLLTWMQMITLLVMCFIEFTLFVIFFDDKKGKKFKVVVGSWFVCVAFICVSCVTVPLSVTVLGNCSSFSLGYARTFGLCSSFVTFVEYLPQLYRTWKCKTGGSMSILANSFQAFGFLVILCFMGGSTEQDITTVLSYIVSLVMHCLLVLMQLIYDYIIPFINKKKGGENQQLITNVSGDEENVNNDLSTPKNEDGMIQNEENYQNGNDVQVPKVDNEDGRPK